MPKVECAILGAIHDAVGYPLNIVFITTLSRLIGVIFGITVVRVV